MSYQAGTMTRTGSRYQRKRRYPYRRRTTSYSSPASRTYKYQPRRDLVPQYPGFSANRMTSGEEWKYDDTVWSTAVNLTYATPNFMLLNGLQVGTGPNQRIGRQVAIRSLLIDYSCQIPGSSPSLGSVRVMVYIDRQCNGSIPATLANSILETDPLHLSPRGLDSRRRYKILYDKLHDLSGINTAGQPSIESAKWFYKFRKPLECNYNAGNVGNATDIVTNAIWFVMFFSIASGAQAYAFNRIRYTDN